MHLYVIAKGHYDNLERWRNDLLAQWLPTYKNGKKVFRGVNADGIPIQEMRRLSIRPVQLYEIGFAKEELDSVLSMVCPMDNYLYHDTHFPALRKFVNWTRKLLGMKEAPIPKTLYPPTQPNPVDKAVMVAPLGLTDDIMSPDGEEQI